MTEALISLGLVLAGALVGCVGTLIGAGGGFLLIPALAYFMPNADTDTLTAISLFVVAFNAASGTVGYARQKKIHYHSGLVFAAAALPGAAMGVFIASVMPRATFDLALGVMLIIGAALVILRALGTAPETPPNPTRRMLVLGAIISVFVGFIASMLGIGGGIIHVPALIYLLHFPAHRATATSHFVLALTAWLAVSVHFFKGDYTGFWWLCTPLALGSIFGAQLGAHLSTKLSARAIATTLAIAMITVGARTIYRATSNKPAHTTPPAPASTAQPLLPQSPSQTSPQAPTQSPQPITPSPASGAAN